MNQKQAIEYLHALQTFGIRPGLERMRALCKILDNPQERTAFVHLAGTNGKGSTCAMLESILRRAGYKTGLFISPYVYDFCERIQIDGKAVSGAALANAVGRVRQAISQMPQELLPVTEFEALTAAAFIIYAEQCCEIVVLETGLGGRLDSTNIIARPLAAVLTSISLDHTNILGDTIEEIAAEKCGILKGGAAVIYPEQNPNALNTIQKHAKKTGTRLVFPDMKKIKELDADCYGTDFECFFDGNKLKCRVSMLGKHMLLNAVVAIKTAELLRSRGGLIISCDNVVDGIAAAKLPARMELSGGILGQKPLTLTDGGHNPACAEVLSSVLERHFGGWEVEMVCGMMLDKDAQGYLAKLAPYISRMAAVTLPPPRGQKAETLAKLAFNAGIECDAVESPQDAYNAALKRLRDKENSLLLVCGSFVLAGILRS